MLRAMPEASPSPTKGADARLIQDYLGHRRTITSRHFVFIWLQIATATLPIMTVYGKAPRPYRRQSNENRCNYPVTPNIIFGKAPQETACPPAKRRQPEP
jgi:hypothetical protein